MNALTHRRRQLRVILPMVALLAVTAVAAMLIPSPNPVARAQGGTCAYAQTAGGLADLTFKQDERTTWEMGRTNTFTSTGPYVGRVQVNATAGTEVSTDPTFSCGSGTQSITIQKSGGPTQIHVQRCDPDQHHIQFTTVLLDGCSGQISTAYSWEWLEPTDAPIQVGPPLTRSGSQTTGGTSGNTTPAICDAQGQSGNSNVPNTLRTKGGPSIRGRWTGPNASNAQQITDSMRAHGEATQLIRRVRDGKATAEEAQETADTLWLMSHEFRSLNVSYDYEKTGRIKLFWDLVRHWATDEGLTPSEEARTAGVPWPVFYNRYGETFTPKQARERYGGAPDGHIGLWRNRNPVAWYTNDPGGLDEALVGPPKAHGEGKAGDHYSEQDGTWITQAEAFSKYGIIPSGTTMAEWEETHGLTPLPEWKHPDEQETTEPAPTCTGTSQPTQPVEPENSDRCSGDATEIVLTTDLNGVREIDLAQFPGLDHFAHFRRRKRGNPPIGGTERWGVLAYRGRWATGGNPPTPATGGGAPGRWRRRRSATVCRTRPLYAGSWGGVLAARGRPG